eukprot:1140536-Pelagomonas_calceolata.AAC.4
MACQTSVKPMSRQPGTVHDDLCQTSVTRASRLPGAVRDGLCQARAKRESSLPGTVSNSLCQASAKPVSRVKQAPSLPGVVSDALRQARARLPDAASDDLCQVYFSLIQTSLFQRRDRSRLDTHTDTYTHCLCICGKKSLACVKTQGKGRSQCCFAYGLIMQACRGVRIHASWQHDLQAQEEGPFICTVPVELLMIVVVGSPFGRPFMCAVLVGLVMRVLAWSFLVGMVMRVLEWSFLVGLVMRVLEWSFLVGMVMRITLIGLLTTALNQAALWGCLVFMAVLVTPFITGTLCLQRPLTLCLKRHPAC